MRKILLISILVLLTGCNQLHPYRVEVQQGNIIDKNTLAQLHTGLSKEQVSSILGASLIENGSGSNTWTYIYTKQTNDGRYEKKKLVLEFKNNRLVQIN